MSYLRHSILLIFLDSNDIIQKPLVVFGKNWLLECFRICVFCVKIYLKKYRNFETQILALKRIEGRDLNNYAYFNI